MIRFNNSVSSNRTTSGKASNVIDRMSVGGISAAKTNPPINKIILTGSSDITDLYSFTFKAGFKNVKN